MAAIRVCERRSIATYPLALSLLLLAAVSQACGERRDRMRSKRRVRPSEPTATHHGGARGGGPRGGGFETEGVRRAGRRDLLRGPRQRGKVGDWVVRNEHLVAIFRAADGRLVDFGPRRGADVLHRADTELSDTRGRYRVFYRQSRAISTASGDGLPGGSALELRGEVRDRDLNLAVQTRVWAPAGKRYLVLHSRVTNRATRRVLGFGLGDAVFLGNTRHFIPGLGLVAAKVVRHAHWLSRRGPGFTIGLVTGEQQPMRIKLAMGHAAWNATTRTTYRAVDLPPGATVEARRYLFHHPGNRARASAMIQGLIGGAVREVGVEVVIPAFPATPAAALGSGDRVVSAGDLKPLAAELEIRREGAPVLRTLISEARTKVTLAAGARYEARVWLPGVGFGPATTLDLRRRSRRRPDDGGHSRAKVRLPPYGSLAFEVIDVHTRPLPASLRFHGVGRTPTPNFGDDGSAAGALNLVYSAAGKGSRILAPGRYEIVFSHGLEYGIHRATVAVGPRKITRIRAMLAPEIQTLGAIAADLHLHAGPSPDSDLAIGGRVTQLAAAGIEYAVATDHNAVTDYGPAIKAAELQRRLVSDVGCEITTRRAEYGHFNVWPLAPGAATPPFFDKSPRDIFDHIHALSTKPVIQVNHPRMGGIGYLDKVDFDAQLGRSFAPGMAHDFHAIEVFNGDYLHQPAKVMANLQEWFALLNLGRRYTATGNSDAHKLAYQEAGYPRNYVLVAPRADDPSQLTGDDGHANAVLHDALRGHRVIVTSGPYPMISAPVAGGRFEAVVGELLKGPVTLTLTVNAACWVPVREVQLIANGVVIRTWRMNRTLGMRLPPRSPGGPFRCKPLRLGRTLPMAPKKDTWYVLLARGEGPLPPLGKRPAAVLGFTNPVWIDADGDGRFTAPGLTRATPTR